MEPGAYPDSLVRVNLDSPVQVLLPSARLMEGPTTTTGRTFGKKVRERRTILSLSRQEAARRIRAELGEGSRFSDRNLQRIEKDEADPRQSVMAAIARVLALHTRLRLSDVLGEPRHRRKR